MTSAKAAGKSTLIGLQPIGTLMSAPLRRGRALLRSLLRTHSSQPSNLLGDECLKNSASAFDKIADHQLARPTSLLRYLSQTLRTSAAGGVEVSPAHEPICCSCATHPPCKPDHCRHALWLAHLICSACAGFERSGWKGYLR